MNNDEIYLKKRMFWGIVYEKVFKMFDFVNIFYLNFRDFKFYYVVMKVKKRKVFKLENLDVFVVRRNIVFIRYWKWWKKICFCKMILCFWKCKIWKIFSGWIEISCCVLLFLILG